jgi:thiol reductant ABC exporter CydC subunit
MSGARALAHACRAPRCERARLARSVALAAAAAAAAIALLGTSGYLISRAAQRPQVLALMGAIVGVRAFAITRAVARYGERLSAHDLALRQLARMRVAFYRALWPLVPAGLARRGGDLLSRFVADVDALQDLYPRVLIPALVSVLVVAGSALAAWLILPAAGFVLLASLSLTALVLPSLSAMAAARSARRQAPARAQLTGELVEAIDGAPELALAGRSHDHAAGLAASDARLARIARGDSLATSAASVAGGVLSAAGMLAMLLVSVPALHAGEFSGVLLAALALVLLASYESVLALGEAARRMRVCSASARRVHELTTQAPAVIDPARPRVLAPAADAEGVLALAGVSFRYGDEEPLLLEHASFELHVGESVALVGPSGTGKSTLAELLVRFRDPCGGRVTIDGVDERELSQDQVRAQVALCAQDCHLFNSSIRENLLLANREASDGQIMRALSAVELDDLVRSLPRGLDTLAGQDGELLSGGQRRRVAFARALLSRARFLILDEPSAHLDARLAVRVIANLREACAGRGLLAITHDTGALDGFDQVLELRAGALLRRRARL